MAVEVTGSAPPSDDAALGRRIAGIALIVNALIFIGFSELGGKSTQGSSSSASTGLLPLFFDIAIGGSLVQGDTKYLTWARIRIVCGLLLCGGFALAVGSAALAALQLLVSGSLLLLLVGEPGKPRIVAGTVGFGVYAAICGVLFVALVRGEPIFASLAYRGKTVAIPQGAKIDGLSFKYKLVPPTRSWRILKDEFARKGNALADRWLIDTSKDAHLIVIGERVRGATFDLQKLEEIVLAGARKNAPDLRVLDSRATNTRTRGRLVRASATAKGMAIEFFYGIFAADDVAFQVIGFAPKFTAKSVEKEIIASIETFDAN